MMQYIANKRLLVIGKKLIAITCLIMSSNLSIANGFEIFKLNKKGLFDTKVKLRIDSRHFMYPIDLKPYQKLIIRHKEFFAHGPETECGNIENTITMREGKLKAKDFDPYITQMIRNAGKFEVIEEFNGIRPNTLNYLFADVSMHWLGCNEYLFEMRIIHPNNGNEKELFFIGMSANITFGVGRKLTHPVLNAYIQWVEKGNTNDSSLKPAHDFFEEPTITIGNQTWMQKNLNVATFKNGDIIKQATSENDWMTAYENKEPAWCYFQFNPINGNRFGKLYNHYAVEDLRGLAPEGWRIPTRVDWDNLTNKELTSEKLKNANEDLKKKYDIEKLNNIYLSASKDFKKLYIKLSLTYDSLLYELEKLEEKNTKLLLKKKKELAEFEVNRKNQLYAALKEESKEFIDYLLELEKVNKSYFKELKTNEVKWFYNLITPKYWPNFLYEKVKANGFNALPGGMISYYLNSIEFKDIYESGHYPRSTSWWYINQKGKCAGYYTLNSSDESFKSVPQITINDFKYTAFSIRCLR